jgi:hypothetical protein
MNTQTDKAPECWGQLLVGRLRCIIPPLAELTYEGVPVSWDPESGEMWAEGGDRFIPLRAKAICVDGVAFAELPEEQRNRQVPW